MHSAGSLWAAFILAAYAEHIHGSDGGSLKDIFRYGAYRKIKEGGIIKM